LLFAITISSCTEKKYDYSIDISVPKEYPVAIQRGFVGKSFFGSFCVSSSWGVGIEVAKKQSFTVPETLEITWLSLVERKFYKGKWNLPKEKIEEYLEKGFNFPNKKINFNKAQIGLAPKGVVVVWLVGDLGIQLEIVRYQATQINLFSEDVYDNAKFMFEKDFVDKKLNDLKFMPAEVKESIKENGYDLYRKKYSWKPNISVPDGCEISQIGINMCNGENEIIFGNSNLNEDKRSIPYQFKVVWKDKKGQEFISRIVFTKDKDYWQKHFSNAKVELPLNFDKNPILNQFTENIKSNLSTDMVIKIDNQIISDFYLEQENKKFPIMEFSQNTEKTSKKKPCICK